MTMPPSTRRLRLLVALLLLLCVLLADQASKSAVLEAASGGRIPQPLTGWFNLVLVWNKGMSFGMFAGNDPVTDALTAALALKALAILLIGGLLVWLWKAEHWVQAAALGFIVGGALGNLVDRFRYGAVVDFLDFHWHAWHYPAFNVADAGIFVGVVLLVLESIVTPARRPDAPSPAETISPPQEPPHA